MKKTIYDYKALEFSGQERSLEDFAGKVVLIVNTASSCYFRRQFKSLEKLYQEFKAEGLEILAFPSNDFFEQEPRTGRNLETYCRLQEQVTFPVFKRIHVKGEYIHPLYSYLSQREHNGSIDSKPLWNFHKYLVNKNGEVVDYFYTPTSPLSDKIKTRIRSLLQQ
ncbi:glutathione peroxidase [Sphingobacterium sp. Mn56C]|uniref:glutathione peroxidase n=1 Tax=Sphingobacterium sp. Mn56C TaxID=3395261 RepID=UPI003BEB81A5